MTPEEFNAEFDKIRKSAFRFEGLAVYDIDEEDEDLVAWQRGLAMAERSVRTSPWLARIARQTVSDEVELAALSSTAGILRASGVPLNEWLAEHADELQGAARAAG
jgi:hypothetical protein